MFGRTIATALATAALTAGPAQTATARHPLTPGLRHVQTERALGVPAPGVGVVVGSVPVSRFPPSGFSWVDALTGAAMAAGVFLLGGAGALTLRRRRRFARR
jgi:hypothetical protein